MKLLLALVYATLYLGIGLVVAIKRLIQDYKDAKEFGITPLHKLVGFGGYFGVVCLVGIVTVFWPFVLLLMD